jgi:hypothetical protein
MIKIECNAEFGRMIIATKNIPRNTIIEICEILVLSKEDTALVNKTDLQYYTFVYNQFQDCLVLGNGEIYNHSDDANVKYDLLLIDDRIKMVFTSVCNITAGDQCFTNYSQDDLNIDASGYINNKSLIGG